METPFMETEALLAVMDDDGGEDRARDILGRMLPGELVTFGRQVDRLHDLVEEELAGR